MLTSAGYKIDLNCTEIFSHTRLHIYLLEMHVFTKEKCTQKLLIDPLGFVTWKSAGLKGIKTEKGKGCIPPLSVYGGESTHSCSRTIEQRCQQCCSSVANVFRKYTGS